MQMFCSSLGKLCAEERESVFVMAACTEAKAAVWHIRTIMIRDVMLVRNIFDIDIEIGRDTDHVDDW